MGIIQWIYCLDLPSAAMLVAALTIGFLLLKKYLGKYLWWKLMLAAALLLCLGAVLYTTVWNRGTGEAHQVFLQPLASYRLMLESGNREILRSNFMNALLFYPAGLLGASLLPRKWPVWCRILLTLVLLTLLSVGIEGLQYVRSIGQVETDDVLHNALGAMLGGGFGSIPLGRKERASDQPGSAP